MPIDDTLRARVQAWVDDDPDPATRAELTDLLDRDDAHDELQERFGERLAFGTAGLRGVLGGGPNRMNRKIVLEATAGLCAYVKDQVPEATERGVCIGFDGRHLSLELADDATRVALGMGFRVERFREVVPTPVLGFACLRRGAAAGIMITASHNPPAYNGYKVYWANGAQIIPPHDKGIAAAIDAVESVRSLALGDIDEARASGRLVDIGEELDREYLDAVKALPLHPEVPRSLSIAYTALHGVGNRLALAAFAESGFSEVHSVPEQAEPDGDFPTVAFPNPEEEGAMDLVLALATAKGADLVLANDPDADRLAVAVRDGEGYRQLTGNEVGLLLGDYLLGEGDQEGDRVVINTIVSSPLLQDLAAAHGARFEQVLTGFKWIANRAIAITDAGARFVYGYEEALGYSVGDLVRDKDGISTAVVMADLAAFRASQGQTLLDDLDRLARRYGVMASRQVSVVLPGSEGAARITAIMDAVRSSPFDALGPYRVTATTDVLTGKRTTADGAAEPIGLPKGNVLSFDLEGGHRVMLRPSGTEPKIKYYFDVRVEPGAEEASDTVDARAQALIDELVDALGAVIGEGGPRR